MTDKLWCPRPELENILDLRFAGTLNLKGQIFCKLKKIKF